MSVVGSVPISAVANRALAGVVMLLAISPTAHAQGEDEARARELFGEAQTAFMEGRLPEARARLEASLDLLPRAPTAINLARVLRSLGELLLAGETLEQLLDGRFGSLTAEQRESLIQLRAQVQADVGSVEVSFEGAERATLSVDGERAATVESGDPFLLRANPGEHIIRADAANGAAGEARIDLAPGAHSRVSLALTGGPEPQEDVLSTWWFWTFLGGGLVIGGAIAVVLWATIEVPADPIEPPLGNAMALRSTF